MLRIRHLACAVAVALTANAGVALAQQTADTEVTADPTAPVGQIPTGPLPRTVVPTLVELQLKLDPAQERFSGRTSIHAEVAEATDVIWMHGRGLDIGSAEAVLPDGRRIAMDAEQVHVSGVLKLAAAETIPAGQVDIEIAFQAPFGKLMGAYRVKPEDENYIVTQMEPLGARSTFPGFDEPSFKQPWEVTLVVPDEDVAVANAPEAKTVDLDGPMKKVVFRRTEALPSYLIAFAVGPWDVPVGPDIAPNRSRDRPVPLRGVAAAGEGPRMDYALQNTGEIVLALEDYFGIPYPFAKLDNVAAPDFGAGAMENAGLIIYRDTLMLIDDDASARQRQRFWGVSAHELAHQWFGDLVTMKWWDDLWLNEAFATWMGHKITDQLKPEFHVDRGLLEGALRAMEADSLASTRRIHQPIEDFTQIQSAFDGITYQKGGAVLGMFENFIGEENFRKGIHNYLVEHARGNATSADLVEAVAAQSDNPEEIEAAFLSFIDQAGVPMVKVDVDCADGQAPALTLQQQRYLPIGSTASAAQTWGLPMCVRYSVDGQVHEQCGLVEDKIARVELEEAGSCPAWVMPNAHGSGYYRFALAPGWQQSLAQAFDQLDERGQRVYADSVMAAYDSGELTVSQMLAALPQFASADSRQTATTGMGSLEWINEHLLDDEAARDALRAHFAAIYRPKLETLGLEPVEGESDDDGILRSGLIGYFADTLEDPEIRAEFASRGNAVLGLGGDGVLKPDAVPSALRDTAIRMAVEEGGVPAFDLAEKHLRASDDAVIRRELLAAMAGVDDPALAARARAFVFEPGLLRLNEIFIVMFNQLDKPAKRPAVREWLEDNYEELAAKLELRAGVIPAAYGAGMCSVEDANALQQRFAERMENVEGGPLELKQTVESIKLCAAAKAARQDQPIDYGQD